MIDPHLQIIHKLGLYPDRYIIFGSRAINVFGNYSESKDLDIYTNMSPSVLKKKGLILDTSVPDIKNRFHDKDNLIDVFADPKEFEKYLPGSHIVNGYRYMGYEDLLHYYKWLYDLRGKEKYLKGYLWLKSHKPKKMLKW